MRLSWQKTSAGAIPTNAVMAGSDRYVGRCYHQGEIIPGKASRAHKHVFVPYGGKEHKYTEYELLVDTAMGSSPTPFEWIQCSYGNVPANAIVGGNTARGEPYYVARAEVNREMCVGKVHTQHRCAYMPYDWKEYRCNTYEVLCYSNI